MKQSRRNFLKVALFAVVGSILPKWNIDEAVDAIKASDREDDWPSFIDRAFRSVFDASECAPIEFEFHFENCEAIESEDRFQHWSNPDLWYKCQKCGCDEWECDENLIVCCLSCGAQHPLSGYRELFGEMA